MVDSLFCGKATAVARRHRRLAKSPLVVANNSCSLSPSFVGQLPCDTAKTCHRHIFACIALSNPPSQIKKPSRATRRNSVFGGGWWIRFSAEKPRRLQGATGALPRAAFRIHNRKNTAKRQMPFSCVWWGMVDSNHRRRCQQIYSLSPLATREIPHIQFGVFFGAGGRIRFSAEKPRRLQRATGTLPSAAFRIRSKGYA